MNRLISQYQAPAAAAVTTSVQLPYLVKARNDTFVARDHRRRLRLFDQLKPKKNIVLSGDINGQGAYSTGNGSLAWIVSLKMK